MSVEFDFDSVKVTEVTSYKLSETLAANKAAFNVIFNDQKRLDKALIMAAKARVTLQENRTTVTFNLGQQKIVIRKGLAAASSGLTNKDVTLKRFCAIIAQYAAENNKKITNPMSEREGLDKEDHGILYTLNVPGCDLLFDRYPAEICAITMLKIKQAKQLSQKGNSNALAAAEELGRALATKKINGVSAQDWINSNKEAITAQWDLIDNVERTVKASSANGKAIMEMLTQMMEKKE